jgi:hypothetical protein
MPNGANPHEGITPDYTTEHFESICLPLINTFNITHEEAAECLTDIWRAQNQLDKQEWDGLLAKEAQTQNNIIKQQCLDAEDRV